jgi:hypothetical protein
MRPQQTNGSSMVSCLRPTGNHFHSWTQRRLSFLIRSWMSDRPVIRQRSLRQPGPSIDKAQRAALRYLAQGRTSMNIPFDRISWMCPITEVVSLRRRASKTTWIFHGNAKLEDWP